MRLQGEAAGTDLAAALDALGLGVIEHRLAVDLHHDVLTADDDVLLPPLVVLGGVNKQRSD